MSHVHHVWTLFVAFVVISTYPFFFICRTQTRGFQITLYDFLNGKREREDLTDAQSFSLSRRMYSHLTRFRFSFTTRYWLPRNISERETRSQRLAIYGGRTIPGILFSSVEQDRRSGLHSPSFYRDWMPRLTSRRSFWDAPRSPRRDGGEPHRSLLRSLPRHVRAPIQLKRPKQTRTLEERCWFEFVTRTYTYTRTWTRTQ